MGENTSSTGIQTYRSEGNEYSLKIKFSRKSLRLIIQFVQINDWSRKMAVWGPIDGYLHW